MRRVIAVTGLALALVAAGAATVVGNSGEEDNQLLAAHGVRSADQQAVGVIANSASELRAIVKGETHCLLDVAEAGLCKTQEDIDAGHAISTSECQPGLADDKLRILGIAPTGTSRVVVHFDNGDALATTPLEGGEWGIDAPHPSVTKALPAEAEYVGGSAARGPIPVYQGALERTACAEN